MILNINGNFLGDNCDQIDSKDSFLKIEKNNLKEERKKEEIEDVS
jgi:hypothetical protein